uniref:Putative MFS-type transporter C09D4.1 n=2 Tax=Lygus hesperus TaxID=30085 RepID=A0A0A9WRT7_LYGHE
MTCHTSCNKDRNETDAGNSEQKRITEREQSSTIPLLGAECGGGVNDNWLVSEPLSTRINMDPGKGGAADRRGVVVTSADFNSSTKLFESSETKVYTRRWVMLFLFVVLGIVSGFQWIQMSIVQDVLVDYYQVNDIWIEWTATIWSFTSIFFAIPGAWFVENYGLRPVVAVCSFLNLFGCVLKSFSSGRGGFALAFAGQTIASLCQAVTFGLPPRIASVWFGSKEVSTASSIGVLGFLMGVAFGFAIPPFVVQSNPNKDLTKAGLDYLNWTLTGLSAIIFVAVMIWFEEKPPKPPSIATLKQNEVKVEDKPFFESLKQLVRNPGFLMLMVAYGINIGVYCTFSTLLNSFILEYYPNGQKDAGGIGLTLCASGLFGIVFTGWILDKTKKYKEVIVVNLFLELISTICFTFFIDSGSITIQYVTAGAAGIFAAATMSIGYEVATELTYPIAEGTSNGVLSATSQMFAVSLTAISGIILPAVGALRCLYIFDVLLGIATILVFLMPKKYSRQQANSLPSNDIRPSESIGSTNHDIPTNQSTRKYT